MQRTHARRRAIASLVVIGAGALVAACGGKPAPEQASDQVLRVAMGSPGEALIKVWQAVGKEYESKNPGTTVEFNFQDDDLYQTVGLPNLLSGNNAPDVYFEWVGDRLQTRADDGQAADLTSAFAPGGKLAGLFDDATVEQGVVDGKSALVPYTADVSTVLWYNTELLADNGVQPPKTWAELLAACDTLNAKGIIPIATGNKDLWAAGNLGGHIISRVVGEDAYAAAMTKKAKVNTPEWEKALGYVQQLHDRKCVNASANSITDNEGAQLFFQGKAAMHPIGNWLVSWAIEEAPDLEFDYVNLPQIPEGKGKQDSVLGVVTGFVVNDKSAKKDQALDFLALVNSPENVKKIVEAGVIPTATSAREGGATSDERSTRLNELLESTSSLVSPPDVGYDTKVADAVYQAVAKVIGGQATPAQALDDAAGRIG